MKLNDTTLLLGVSLLLVAAPSIYTALGEANYSAGKEKVRLSTSQATSLGPANNSPDRNSESYDLQER